MLVRANSVMLECQVEGTPGCDWLVLSHSIATDLTMWDEQVRVFGDRFHILRYDTRGHGGSHAPPAPYSFADLEADVIGLLDAFEIERAHFVGLSLGGMIALGLAINHPDRLHSIAVCDARPDSPPAFRAPWDERIAVARNEGMPGLVASTLQRWFLPDTLVTQPGVGEHVARMIKKTSVDGFVGCAAALQHLDYEAGLNRIVTPTLLLAGDADGPIPGINLKMAEAIAGARNAVIPGAGHISNLEQPRLFNEALAQFLDDLSAPLAQPRRA
ncbi:alpha/beta fold hydrolase [Ferrovibrio xuzhouensis]|uniref:Alpha/beta fold hydrolase n=1 Tax=Ferrovibrio xuzhouensis TaxID=1576914 RepID=A0ABV7VDL5_9PROT